MTISTFVYFNEETNSQELEEIIDLENSLDLSDLYLTPPEWLVKNTICSVLNC